MLITVTFQLTESDRRVLATAIGTSERVSIPDIEEFIRTIVRDNFDHLHKEHDPPPQVMRIKRRIQ